jgi:hypothetical protein
MVGGTSHFAGFVGPRFLKLFGKSPEEYKAGFEFKRGSPPPEVAGDYQAGAIWEPGDEQGQ